MKMRRRKKSGSKGVKEGGERKKKARRENERFNTSVNFEDTRYNNGSSHLVNIQVSVLGTITYYKFCFLNCVHVKMTCMYLICYVIICKIHVQLCIVQKNQHNLFLSYLLNFVLKKKIKENNFKTICRFSNLSILSIQIKYV